MSGDQEKRKTTRVRYCYPVSLYLEDKSVVHGEIRNLSLKGGYVVGPGVLRVRRQKIVRFQIVLSRKDPDLVIEGTAKVVRKDSKEEGAGIHFEKMTAGSVSHLRRILELNTGDVAKVSRELKYFFE